MSLSPQPAHVDAISAQPVVAPARSEEAGLSFTLLVLNTLRYLRLRQWAYLVIRRLLPDWYRVPAMEVAPEIAAPVLRECSLTAVPHHCLRNDRLCFLNEVAHFPIDAPDWRSSSHSRLWRYNLHYFEYLADPTLSIPQRNTLIDSWIAGNPPGVGEGWEPYPVSLRLISWTRYFDYLLRNGMSINADWRSSIYLHCDWLYQHMEFHIDANHLFKNVMALFMGARLFQGNEDKRVKQWQKKSARWMRIALREQFNSDGGHYERSPMYHLLCLHYCLDSYNLLSKSPAERNLQAQLADVIVKGVAFAHALRHGKDRIALFNDSANGIAPDIDVLCDYARSINASLYIPSTVRHGSSWFSSSGYFCWHDVRQHCVVNAKSPTPAYQPGHSHADCLSFEYSLDGVLIVVNAGNTCYEIGDDRRYARSTAAHNTIEIDGRNQSEIWSAFRMARRAQVRAEAPEHTARGVRFVASHDGYARYGSDVSHQREVIAAPSGIEIHDTLTGRGRHRIRHFTHLHPDVSVVIDVEKSNTFLVFNGQKQVVARILLDTSWGAGTLHIERTPYYDQFGLRQMRDSIIVTGAADFPCAIYFTIQPESSPVRNRK